MDGQSTPLSGLSGELHEQFVEWLDRRKPQEEEFLRVYQDMMRISRDDDTTQTGMSKAQKSKIFIGSTRGKIRSARAKIKDSLFGAGQLPFDTKPTNEKLKGFADTMEEILAYQMEEGGFRKTLGTGVDGITTYGTGFIFGPFVREMKHTSVEPKQEPGGVPKLEEVDHPYDCPYFEHARVMDCYPDPEAEDVCEGRGIYWASRKQPEFIRALKGKPGYSDSAIDKALTEKVTAFTDQGSDRTDAARMNLYRYTREGRIWFTRYFGKVKKRALQDWKKDSLNETAQPLDDDEERVEAVVLMAGGQVIKADENPYKEQKRPVKRCVYEDVEHEMYGVGVGKNNDPHQRVINAAFRLFIEGKAYALLKMCSVDKSKYAVTEDFKFFPGKRFDMRSGLTPDERKTAMIWHDTPDISAGWESLIEMSERFSDDDTAITKYTQGNDSKGLNDTATGISMIMNASSLPIKEVLSNIDEMWIDPMVEDLIDWDLEHLEVETVKVLLGDEQAENWRQIKEYGKANFMEWFATGSATFMAKEVLMHKLQGFLQIVASNEALAAHIDMIELLQQVWDAGQIGKESPVLTEEEMAKKQSGPANQQAMEHIKEIEEQATKLITQANEKAKKAEEAATEAKRMEAYKLADLESREAELKRKHDLALHDTLNKTTEAGEKSHLIEAQIDKLQAETLETLAKAGVAASPALQAKGTQAEGAEEGGEGEAPAEKPDMAAGLAALQEQFAAFREEQSKPRPRPVAVKRVPGGRIMKYDDGTEHSVTVQ